MDETARKTTRPRRVPRLPTEDRLTRQALHYLDRYASSAANLRRVLERKVLKACQAHDKDPADYAALLDAVIAKCERSGVVNDMAYAEAKLASARRKGESRSRLSARLASKGVDRTLIDQVLEADDTPEQETARIFARRRRLGPYRKSGDRSASRDRDLAAMCRAGFGFGVAKDIIDGDGDDDAEHDTRFQS